MGISARSTNVKGFVHFGGDVVAGVEDGIAVHLKSASTGSAAVIEPLSDSDTAALTIRAKGAATLTVGNSSNVVVLAAPLGVGSTFVPTAINRYVVEFTPPELAASTWANSSYTVTGLSTGYSALILTAKYALSGCYGYKARCSTVNELIVTFGNYGASTIGTGESTNRFTVTQIL